MTKQVQNSKSSGNILIIVILAVVGIFLLLKFVAPALGIKLFGKNANSIEYSHVEGFPRTLNVTEQFDKTRLVIRDSEALKKAIQMIDKNNEIKIPEINFDRKIALFVTSKTRDVAGFETRIKKITKDKDDLVVEIRDTEPGDTCINTQQQNLPMDLVILDKTDISIEFEVVRYTKECN